MERKYMNAIMPPPPVQGINGNSGGGYKLPQVFPTDQPHPGQFMFGGNQRFTQGGWGSPFQGTSGGLQTSGFPTPQGGPTFVQNPGFTPVAPPGIQPPGFTPRPPGGPMRIPPPVQTGWAGYMQWLNMMGNRFPPPPPVQGL